MRRSYFRRRSAFFSSPGRVVALVFVILFIAVIGVRLASPSTFFSLAAPFFSIGNFFAGPVDDPESAQIRADRALMNENTALQSRINDLERLLGDAAAPRPGIVAGVIARPPLAPYDTLIVAAGREHGVLHGMTVSADGGVPIGSVDMVSSTHAQVSLFSSAGRETEGWVGEERLPVTVVGKGGGAFEAMVPRDAGIPEGALVYLPGPGARPVGRVIRVEADPSSPSAKLRVEPLANIFSTVEVVIEETP